MTIQGKDFSADLEIVSIKPVLQISGAGRKSLYASYFKRFFDIALVIASAPIVVPFVAILAFLVALDGHKPFFRQMRVGKDGRIFSMWKLRSMVHDADEKLRVHLENDESASAEWNQKQKLIDDPRITPIGRLLRKTSMDELPQLWNVFVGEMSLVGPRPMMPSQKKIYPGVAYYTLRPGLTGYWQISDRNQSSFAARAVFDNQYQKDVSLRTDLSILASTVSVVLRGTGC